MSAVNAVEASKNFIVITISLYATPLKKAGLRELPIQANVALRLMLRIRSLNACDPCR